jgi:hypothetical protein
MPRKKLIVSLSTAKSPKQPGSFETSGVAKLFQDPWDL